MNGRLFHSILALTLVLPPALARGEDWPGWRGPRGDGTSVELEVPTKWNGATGENIAWKVAVPGAGHSSPIISGDRVYVTSCVEETGERCLLAFDRRSGNEVWRRVVLAAPLEKRHQLNSRASGTPATDGQAIYVTFLDPDFASDTERTPGHLVVASISSQGEINWTTRPGRFASTHGFCSSPVLFEGLVIINGDHDGDSYVVALNQQSGEVRWKFDREHKTRSYVTPLIRDLGGRTQMLLSGSKCVVSLNPRTGKLHWSMPGPTEQFVASMVADDDFAYLTAGYPDRHILAIRHDGSGEISDDHIAWRSRKNCAYVPSPVLCNGYLLIAADDGISSCYEARTGKRMWLERTAPHYSASLVTAAGLVYFLSDTGTMKIVRPGATYDLVAENDLGESCYASPAIAEGQLFLRSDTHLFAIGRAP